MSADELVTQLRREAAIQRELLHTALEQADWDEAATAQFGWLFWRAAALAASLRIGMAPLTSAAPLVGRLIGLKASCLSRWAEMGDERPPRFEARKIESLIDALDALQHLLSAFHSDDPNSLAHLALAGGEVGRADIMMTMAEAGHWARVFELEQRHLGLYGGSRDRLPAWEKAFEPEAIKIANGQPVKRSAMITAVEEWHKTYRDQNGKSLNPPGSIKGIGDGIDRLAKKGVITLAHKALRNRKTVT